MRYGLQMVPKLISPLCSTEKNHYFEMLEVSQLSHGKMCENVLNKEY